jgi:hypothetical protein
MAAVERASHRIEPQTFAGNWLKREAFAWSPRDRPDEAEAFGLFVLRTRDSGLIEQSNAAVIARALEPFAGDDEATSDVVLLRCRHFGFGWCDEVAVRVYRTGTRGTTEAFDTLAALVGRMGHDAVLDELDHARRSYDAALENIRASLIGTVVCVDRLPAGWEGQVYRWLLVNDARQLEDSDDRGAAPGDEAVVEALTALCLIAPIDA